MTPIQRIAFCYRFQFRHVRPRNMINALAAAASGVWQIIVRLIEALIALIIVVLGVPFIPFVWAYRYLISPLYVALVFDKADIEQFVEQLKQARTTDE